MSARDAMIRSAAILLAKGGYQATSFATVLEHSGAPRGSIYHHFPGGKDELVGAAIAAAGGQAIGALEAQRGQPPAAIVGEFLALWRAVLVHSHFTAGCSIVAVTVSADNDSLVEQARDTFRAWQASLTSLLEEGGLTDASSYAALLIAATEGAVVMARAEKSLAPFEQVADRLLGQLGSAG